MHEVRLVRSKCTFPVLFVHTSEHVIKFLAAFVLRRLWHCRHALNQRDRSWPARKNEGLPGEKENSSE